MKVPLRTRGRRAFTLVELLVVVAIIALLVSILMPSLVRAQILARLAACQSQMRAMNLALHQYASEYDEQLPWTQSEANPSTCQVIAFFSKVSSFGCFYEGGIIDNPWLMYCPDAHVTSGWGSNPTATRQNFIDNFPTKFANRDGMRVDYGLGFWTQKGEEYSSRPGWAWTGWDPRYPNSLRAGTTIENYQKGRNIWLADEYGIFSYYYLSTFHNEAEFQNVSSVDGSMFTIHDFKGNLDPAAYYFPYNDRPMWGWWDYFDKNRP